MPRKAAYDIPLQCYGPSELTSCLTLTSCHFGQVWRKHQHTASFDIVFVFLLRKNKVYFDRGLRCNVFSSSQNVFLQFLIVNVFGVHYKKLSSVQFWYPKSTPNIILKCSSHFRTRFFIFLDNDPEPEDLR